MSSHRTLLSEVMFIRPIVITLLVIYHSFAMYTGSAWSLPDGIRDVAAYFWIAKASYSFMLEMFVFLSGYILCFQFEKKDFPLKVFFTKKLKRLIIPSIFFSFVYFLFFRQYSNVRELLYDIISGCGHMWYLPMIFWCFMLGYAIHKMQIRDWYKMFFCVVLSCFSLFFKFLPFQLNQSCYYLFYFYLGLFIYQRRDKFFVLSTQKLILLIIIYIVSFVISTLFVDKLYDLALTSCFTKALRMISIPFFKITYSSTGLISFYIITNKLISSNYIKQFFTNSLPYWLIWLNHIAFGVYIYQQFILKFLYYHTKLPQLMGTYALPWVGFLITLLASMILSDLTNRTKFGRFLVG